MNLHLSKQTPVADIPKNAKFKRIGKKKRKEEEGNKVDFLRYAKSQTSMQKSMY